MSTKLNLIQSEPFRQLTDTVKTPVYWKDKEGRCLGCNQFLLEIMGLTNYEQIIGKTDEELWEYAGDHRVWLDSDRLALEHGISEVDVVKVVSGEKRFFSLVKTRLAEASGKVVGILGILSEPTKRMQQQMGPSPDPFTQQIIDNVEASIFWKDREGRYLGCNKFVLKMAGLTSRDHIIGKPDTEFVWKDGCAPAMENDRYVLQHGHYVGEEGFTVADGSRMTLLVVKNRLYDNQGNVIGTIGTALDITAQKEAEKLRQESERQQAALRENFAMTVRKVAHDINSPIAALNMMLDVCNELPEDKRTFLRRATESILDIANNLLSSDQQEENVNDAEIEFREPLLVSDLLIHLLSEKKVQYQDHPVTFETVIAHDVQFAFIQMQKTELRRAMSNLINNAVDALEGKEGGVITVQLNSDADSIAIKVQDNGKGMSRDKVERILEHQSFTEGKENGHGLGLQQVWDMLERNQGTMKVQSSLGKGTSIQLNFPRIAASNWIAQEIHLSADTIIVVLDDDESIHTAWKLRFTPFLRTYPSLSLNHFSQGQDTLDFLNKLNTQEKDRVLFLSDYELLHQKQDGLQIIEASKIKGAILVTSYYSNPKIRDAAMQLNVKILPKQMASVIPIHQNADVDS